MTVSESEARDLAEKAFEASFRFYDQPLSAELEALFRSFPELIQGPMWRRAGAAEGWSEREIEMLVLSVTRAGFALRCLEEQVPNSVASVPFFEVGLLELAAEHRDWEVPVLVLHACGGVAAAQGMDDPWVGVRAVPKGMGDVRRQVAERKSSRLKWCNSSSACSPGL